MHLKRQRHLRKKHSHLDKKAALAKDSSNFLRGDGHFEDCVQKAATALKDLGENEKTMGTAAFYADRHVKRVLANLQLCCEDHGGVPQGGAGTACTANGSQGVLHERASVR